MFAPCRIRLVQRKGKQTSVCISYVGRRFVRSSLGGAFVWMNGPSQSIRSGPVDRTPNRKISSVRLRKSCRRLLQSDAGSRVDVINADAELGKRKIPIEGLACRAVVRQAGMSKRLQTNPGDSLSVVTAVTV